MVWKVKEIKELLKNKHDEDVVEFGHYCQSRDNPIYFERFSLRTRKPKPTEFQHHECKFCEVFELKGRKRKYCNFREDVIGKYDNDSCSQFQHKDYELEYSE